MNLKQPYLKGKSVFVVSLLVVGVTIATVYFTGINYHRSLSSNLYWSLGIIAAALFLFMTYGLYRGIGLIDNFPNYRGFKPKHSILEYGRGPDLPLVDVGEGIAGLIMSILLWIAMTILMCFLLVFLEALFWVSVFIILAMLYWVFIRALKFVFSKSKDTKGDMAMSAVYSLGYTSLYVGWLFGIVYLTEVLK